MNDTNTTTRLLLCSLLTALSAAPLVRADATDHDHPAPKSESGRLLQPRATPGTNDWNKAREPQDWWGEIERMHGHVGPWNVLGWRMGKAVLRELDATWGGHELDIVCHVPLETPFSCLADGLVVGTGNTIGRLDLRLAEVMSVSSIQVSVRRKDGAGGVRILKPSTNYLATIRGRQLHELEALSRECGRLPEETLFAIERSASIVTAAQP